MGRAVREETGRKEKVREEKGRRKKIRMCKKGRRVAKQYVFPMICGCGRSKSRLAKAAGMEQSGKMRDDKLHAVEV